MTATDLPTVDLSLPEPELVPVIKMACMEHGFFYLENHGVPAELLDSAMAQQRALFSLSPAQKAAMLADGNNRGYTPMKEETLDPDNQSTGDTKEGFYIGAGPPVIENWEGILQTPTMPQQAPFLLFPLPLSISPSVLTTLAATGEQPCPPCPKHTLQLPARERVASQHEGSSHWQAPAYASVQQAGSHVHGWPCDTIALPRIPTLQTCCCKSREGGGKQQRGGPQAPPRAEPVASGGHPPRVPSCDEQLH